MTNLTKRQKELLSPWSELYARLYERVGNLSDEQLNELADACSAVTSTNCWCMTYDVAGILKGAIEDARSRRPKAAQVLEG